MRGQAASVAANPTPLIKFQSHAGTEPLGNLLPSTSFILTPSASRARRLPGATEPNASLWVYVHGANSAHVGTTSTCIICT